jgi:hypothetical protein
MSSVFYKAQFEQRFPIPLIAFEHLTAKSSLSPEDLTLEVLSACCGKPNPTQEDIGYFLAVIQQESTTAQQVIDEAPSAEAATAKAKTLGAAFQQFLQTLDSARILLWACGYDYQRAEYLYTKVDRSIANQIIEDFLKILHEQNTYLFEAGLYGFGGSYKNDSPGEDLVDMTEMDASSIMQMLSQ